MNDLPISPKPWMRWIAQGVGGGTAVILGLAIIEAVKQRPEFLPQLLTGSFLQFVALVVGMVIFDRRLQSFSELQSRHVAAQERLASGVNALVEKDDARGEAQEAALRYVASQNEEIIGKLKEIDARLPHAG